MRLVDADKIYSDLINIKENTKATGNEVIFSLNDVITIINGSPTAYNVDNVLEELEEYKNKFDESDAGYIHDEVDNAIDIVKKGGAE